MPTVTRTHVPDAPAPDRIVASADEVAAAAHLLADAVAEFDAALDEGRGMPTLVKLDREVVVATRRHRAASDRVACTA